MESESSNDDLGGLTPYSWRANVVTGRLRRVGFIASVSNYFESLITKRHKDWNGKFSCLLRLFAAILSKELESQCFSDGTMVISIRSKKRWFRFVGFPWE